MNVSPLHLTHTHDGRVAVLRFDHGKANEMGSACLRALERLVAHLASPGGPVALITHSTKTSRRGTPIFVAGADVTEREGWTNDAVQMHVLRQRRVLAALRRAPVFHVVVVSGVALGWGTEYLLTADWRVATPGAVFGLPETGLGIVPGAGGTSSLYTEIGVGHTLRLGMTGERIQPEEAARIGLVHEVAEHADAGMARAVALAEQAASRSPTANAAFKAAVLGAVARDPSFAAHGEGDAYRHCLATGEAAVGRASFAAIRAGEVPGWGPRILSPAGEEG